MSLFKQFPRAFATIVVTVLGMIFFPTDFENGLDFFELIFSGFGIGVGTGLSLLLTWIGDREIFTFNITPTISSILIGLGVVLLAVVGGEEGATLQQFLANLAATGEIVLGAVIGVLVKLFGDRNIPVFLDAQFERGE